MQRAPWLHWAITDCRGSTAGPTARVVVRASPSHSPRHAAAARSLARSLTARALCPFPAARQTDYLAPAPAMGVHRYIFVLFKGVVPPGKKQEGRICWPMQQCVSPPPLSLSVSLFAAASRPFVCV